MSNHSFEEILFSSPDYDESLHLRYKVLREPLGLDYSEAQIEEEWNQHHFVIRNVEGEIVACLLFQKINSDTLKMRQVAVALEYQKNGLGKQMVLESELWANRNNYNNIELHARDIAVPFYLKLNYLIEGEEFLEVGIPHRAMKKNLN